LLCTVMSSLRGNTFVLTGASSGIGRALALLMAKAGINLVLNARRGDLLEEVARECRSAGASVRYVTGDAARAETTRQIVKVALASGRFAGFVHAAAVARPGPYLWELPPNHFREIMDASVVAAYQLIRFAVPELRKQGEGMCVFFGSGAAEVTMPGLGTYCVAKVAEEHLARQLADEAPDLVCFAYRPGIVDTPMQKQAREAEGGAAEFLHKEFRAYKQQGMLISPERAAGALLKIMSHNPRRFHGAICSWRDGA